MAGAQSWRGGDPQPSPGSKVSAGRAACCGTAGALLLVAGAEPGTAAVCPQRSRHEILVEPCASAGPEPALQHSLSLPQAENCTGEGWSASGLASTRRGRGPVIRLLPGRMGLRGGPQDGGSGLQVIRALGSLSRRRSAAPHAVPAARAALSRGMQAWGRPPPPGLMAAWREQSVPRRGAERPAHVAGPGYSLPRCPAANCGYAHGRVAEV